MNITTKAPGTFKMTNIIWVHVLLQSSTRHTQFQLFNQSDFV